MSKIKNDAVGALSIVIGLLGTTQLIWGTWQGLHGELQQAAFLTGAGLVMVLVATIERFEAFKAIGIFEAKLREKVGEAERLFAQLRRLTEISGGEMIRLSALSGRISTVTSAKERYELAKEIRLALNEAGSPEDAIRPAMEIWARTLSGDLICKITGPLREEKFSGARAISKRISDNPNAKIADDPTHATLIAQQQSHAKAWKKMESFGTWPLDGLSSRILDAVEKLPEVDAEAKDRALEELRGWKPDLDYLAKTLDLLHPQKWFDTIDRDDSYPC